MTNWLKSSFCSNSTCVEVLIETHLVSVRDGAHGYLEFQPAEWSAFIRGVRNNEFDLPEQS